MENNWRYIGLFLTEESKNTLVRQFTDEIPGNWKIYAHHMTLAFNRGDKESQTLYNLYKGHFGEPYSLIIDGVGKSNDAIAVRVRCRLKRNNKIAHITLAVPEGGKPVNSNDIIDWNSIPPFSVNATFGEFCK